MSNQAEPVVLDLAPLPRDKIGPFLILGLEKDATKEQIEASWARRLIWSRKNQVCVSLEDINWAKETIIDADKRPKADAASLNLDLIDGTVRRITKKYGSQGTARPTWQPVDIEEPPETGAPESDLPDWQKLRDAVALPEIPQDVPALQTLLTQLVEQPLNPWEVLPTTEEEL